MKKSIASKILLAVLVLALLVSVLPMAAFAAEGDSYVLEASTLTAFSKTKADGETEVAGTDGYFTLHWSTGSKVDSSKKTFEDDYYSEQRINFGGKTQWGDYGVKNGLEFTTESPVDVKIWWVQAGGKDGKANRANIIFDKDGNVVAQDNGAEKGNGEIVVSTISLDKAGNYFLGTNEGGCNYLFKIEVIEKAGEASAPDQMAWVKVTDASTLKAGDKLILVSTDGLNVATAMNGKSYLNVAEVTDWNALPADVAELTLGGSEGAWTLANAEGGLLAIKSDSNAKMDWENSNNTWTITIDAEGIATIQTTNADLVKCQIRWNKSSPRFGNYGTDSSCTLPMLYRWEAVATNPTPPTGDATPIFFLGAMAVIAMGGILVLRKQKTW